MNLIDLIEEDIARHKTRTIAKIHMSWAAYNLLVRDRPKNGLDLRSGTLLGCQLEIHMNQVDPYYLEDVNGLKIFVSNPYARL